MEVLSRIRTTKDEAGRHFNPTPAPYILPLAFTLLSIIFACGLMQNHGGYHSAPLEMMPFGFRLAALSVCADRKI